MDTDTIVAAMRSPTGASAALILAAAHGRATLLATVPLFIEYEAVCTRAEHMLAAGLDGGGVATFLDYLADLIEPVEPWFLWRPRLRDPADEIVLEAAVNGQADVLVSFNQKHFRSAAAQFDLDVVLPGEALRRL